MAKIWILSNSYGHVLSLQKEKEKTTDSICFFTFSLSGAVTVRRPLKMAWIFGKGKERKKWWFLFLGNILLTVCSVSLGTASTEEWLGRFLPWPWPDLCLARLGLGWVRACARPAAIYTRRQLVGFFLSSSLQMSPLSATRPDHSFLCSRLQMTFIGMQAVMSLLKSWAKHGSLPSLDGEV